MRGRGTHIQMSGQSRAYRRAPEAKPLSDPEGSLLIDITLEKTRQFHGCGQMLVSSHYLFPRRQRHPRGIKELDG